MVGSEVFKQDISTTTINTTAIRTKYVLAKEMEYLKDKRYEGVDMTSINCRNLFLLVLFTTLNVAQNAPLPPPTIIVFSITSNNPLHMVLGDSPYATTDISLGKSKW